MWVLVPSFLLYLFCLQILVRAYMLALAEKYLGVWEIGAFSRFVDHVSSLLLGIPNSISLLLQRCLLTIIFCYSLYCKHSWFQSHMFFIPFHPYNCRYASVTLAWSFGRPDAGEGARWIKAKTSFLTCRKNYRNIRTGTVQKVFL